MLLTVAAAILYSSAAISACSLAMSLAVDLLSLAKSALAGVGIPNSVVCPQHSFGICNLISLRSCSSSALASATALTVSGLSQSVNSIFFSSFAAGGSGAFLTSSFGFGESSFFISFALGHSLGDSFLQLSSFLGSSFGGGGGGGAAGAGGEGSTGGPSTGGPMAPGASAFGIF